MHCSHERAAVLQNETDSASTGLRAVSGLCGTGYGLGRDLEFSLIALTALESACLIFYSSSELSAIELA